jgi:secretion/DNA translocation related TadE-like protein
MPDGHLLPHRSSTPHDGRVAVRRPAWGCGPAPLRAVSGAVRDAATRRRIAHPHPAGESRRTDRGVVTAEFAMALPAVVIVLAAVLATATVALNQMRCTDAAREAARAAARNEPAATVAAVARAEGPPGAEVQVSRVGDRVVVTVSAGVKVRLLGTETIRVSSRAVAVREPAGQLVAAPVAWRRRRPPSGTGSQARRRRSVDRPHEVLQGPRIGTSRADRGAAPRERDADDAGAGTVLVVGLVAVGVLLALAVSLLGQVVAARHRASAAADLAALAAARTANASPAATTSVNPCDVALRIAQDNDAALTSCGVDDAGVATVSVRTDIKSGTDVLYATAQARAGPAAIAERDQ